MTDTLTMFGLAIHGGAGTILRTNMTVEQEAAYRETLSDSLRTGYDVLSSGGTSLDAVCSAVMVMENSPLFNAGKGSVFTSAGENEMDACLMDGTNLECGAVAAVKGIKNPIQLARLVMERSDHVLLVADGAEAFACEAGLEIMPDDYFFTERRWQQLQKAQNNENAERSFLDNSDRELGTVGAVALDRDGNLAAATSTGGMTNKSYGRVGDSALVGAGTYANNATCAVSGTGQGEHFMRGVVAYDLSAIMEYSKLSLREAAEIVVARRLTAAGGTGGVIAIDNKGNVAMPFNCEGMYRGVMLSGKDPIVAIYREEI